MSIKQLYSSYFQKSKTFLFPALEIRKGPFTTPLQTFITWEGQVSVTENKLICLYNTTDATHEVAAQNHLFTNPQFEKFFDLPDQQRLYVFDLSLYADDVRLFLEGRYSQLSLKLKDEIMRYFGRKSPEYLYVETFLFPERFYDIYSELLDVDVEVLEEVGELCNRYDSAKENCTLVLKHLEKLDIKV